MGSQDEFPPSSIHQPISQTVEANWSAVAVVRHVHPCSNAFRDRAQVGPRWIVRPCVTYMAPPPYPYSSQSAASFRVLPRPSPVIRGASSVFLYYHPCAKRAARVRSRHQRISSAYRLVWDAEAPHPRLHGRLLLPSNRARPRVQRSMLNAQRTAFFTSAAIFASSAAVSSLSAKATGHRAPSSRCALSLKPSVAYRVLNFSAGWKKQTILPPLSA